jgi:hypothetical protein
MRILVVPPSMHRVHHSESTAETNSNYGTIFSGPSDCATTLPGSASGSAISGVRSGKRPYSF